MPTLTSTGNCNLTSSTNWSPALVPTTGDDLIVGAHTLTLDANITLNSLTFSATTSRLAYSGGPRTITVTGNVIFSAAISASLLTLTAGQELIFIVGGFRTTANVVQYPFTVSGGTLRLYGTGSSTNSDLIDPTTANSFRLFQTTTATSVAETRGRMSIGAGTHNLVLISGGTWTHAHTGTTSFNSITATSKFVTVSGALVANISFTGDVSTTVPVSATGLITMSGSSSVLDWNGNIEATEALGAGALLNLTAGTINLIGRICHVSGTNSLTFLMSGGTFNHANQSITIPSNRTYTAYATAGVFNIGGLLVDNQNDWVVILSGTVSGTSTGAVITTAAGGSAAINLLSPTFVNIEAGPAVLPSESEVLSGVVYGYTGTERTGTAVLLSPANLRSALGLASANLDTQLSDIPTVAEFNARTLPSADYFVVSDYTEPPSASSNATAVRSELATELGRIDAAVSSRLAASSYTAPANSDISAIKAVTDKLDTAIVLDGSVYQFTVNALENAPTGGGGGGGGLTAADIRAAIGLASANLDAQLSDLPTVSEFNARTLPSADYFVVSDYTAPPSAATNAAAVWDRVTTDHTSPGSFGSKVLISSGNQREVQVTNGNHVAADVHAFQSNTITAASIAVSAIEEIQTGLALETTAQAIKTKTDNLPSDPADQSILMTAIGAIPTSTDPSNRLLDVWRRLGLDPDNPLVNTADAITAGSVLQITVTQTSTSVTTTRQP